MGNAIRDKDPTIYRLITIRTIEARLLITPSNNVRKLVGGIIARYQEILGVEIFTYIVLSNHVHLVARAPRSNIDVFEENVNREMSRRLNWKNHRSGKFWGRPYDDLQILTEDDLLEAFLYVTTNATRHGLVENPGDWPGLHAFEHVQNEKDRFFTFHHYSAVKEEERTTTHRLRLTVLPQFAKLSREKRKELIKELLVRRVEKIACERREKGQGFLGLDAIRNQVPGLIPREVSRAPRPACYTQCSVLRKKFKQERRAHHKAYAEASFRYRLGDRSTIFPPHTFLPPLHRLPRLFPFQPLSPDSVKIPI